VQKPWLGDTGDGQRTIGAPLAPTNELEAMVELHLEALTVKQYSEQTIKARRDQLKVFLRWCAGQAFTSPREITSPLLERYQRYLYLLSQEERRIT
jgi:integrase/recombinase XerD